MRKLAYDFKYRPSLLLCVRCAWRLRGRAWEEKYGKFGGKRLAEFALKMAARRSGSAEYMNAEDLVFLLAGLERSVHNVFKSGELMIA